jgi:hypothetical protein
MANVGTMSFDEPLPPPSVKGDPGLFARKSGEVERTAEYRASRAMDTTPTETLDPEESIVSDVSLMVDIIDEEMGKLYAPEELRESWKAKGYRTWNQAPRKSAKFTITGIVGKVKVKGFREMVKAAVVGGLGGSMLSVIKNQQFNGQWEPVNHGSRRDIIGRDHHLRLLVEFIDINDAPHIKYDTTGKPVEVDPMANGGMLTAEVLEVLRSLRHPAPAVVEGASDVDAMKAELAEMKAKFATLMEKLGEGAPDKPVAKKQA